jgi:hypothetical protein
VPSTEQPRRPELLNPNRRLPGKVRPGPLRGCLALLRLIPLRRACPQEQGGSCSLHHKLEAKSPCLRVGHPRPQRTGRGPLCQGKPDQYRSKGIFRCLRSRRSHHRLAILKGRLGRPLGSPIRSSNRSPGSPVSPQVSAPATSPADPSLHPARGCNQRRLLGLTQRQLLLQDHRGQFSNIHNPKPAPLSLGLKRVLPGSLLLPTPNISIPSPGHPGLLLRQSPGTRPVHLLQTSELTGSPSSLQLPNRLPPLLLQNRRKDRIPKSIRPSNRHHLPCQGIGRSQIKEMRPASLCHWLEQEREGSPARLHVANPNRVLLLMPTPKDRK